MSEKDIPITITPEERDIPDLIRVFKGNINSPRGEWPRNPSAFLTKGQMGFLVEILEQRLAQGQELNHHSDEKTPISSPAYAHGDKRRVADLSNRK
jgi:hypothetical protein